MRCTARVVLIMALAVVSPGALAQPPTGAFDTRRDIDEQVAFLKLMLRGDVAAEKQGVMLRWLADLYTSAGRYDEAEQAYDRILVFFAYDVATRNAYAEFLLAHRNAPERADKILRDGLTWSNSMEEPSPYVGRSHAILARALESMGRCEEALVQADHALALLDQDASEDAQRTRARCLATLGRADDARAVYLSLIGSTGGASPDDMAALVRLLAQQSGKSQVSAAQIERSVARAIDDARAKRRAEAKAEGAQIVELQSGGVRLEATLRRGTAATAVLFVPGPDARRSDYTPYAQLMMLDGSTTMTVDLRGQGDSRADSLPSSAELPEHHRDQLPDDIAAAVAYLRDECRIPETAVAVVAAGVSSSMLERAMHEHGIAPLAVHLSPVFDPADLALATALSFRSSRPALLLASSEDMFAVTSISYFRDARAGAEIESRSFAAAGHGVALLRDPANYLVVDGWLKQHLSAP